jgi:hypothetical protein
MPNVADWNQAPAEAGAFTAPETLRDPITCRGDVPILHWHALYDRQ